MKGNRFLEYKTPGFDKERMQSCDCKCKSKSRQEQEEKESEKVTYGAVKCGNNPLGGIWNMGGVHVHDCICGCLKRVAKVSEFITARGSFDKTSQEEALYAAAWGVKWNEGGLTELIVALDKIHQH